MIDKKGDLFGKINYIDFLLIVFIILSFAVLAVSYNRFNHRKHSVSDTAEKKVMRMKIEGPMILEEAARAAKVGDKDMFGKGEYWAVIDEIKVLHPTSPQYEAGGPDRYATLLLTLRVRLQKRDMEYVYMGQPVKVNKAFTFQTPDYEIGGRIVSLKNE